jgi:hypothetical protein
MNSSHRAEIARYGSNATPYPHAHAGRMALQALNKELFVSSS